MTNSNLFMLTINSLCLKMTEIIISLQQGWGLYYSKEFREKCFIQGHKTKKGKVQILILQNNNKDCTKKKSAQSLENKNPANFKEPAAANRNNHLFATRSCLLPVRNIQRLSLLRKLLQANINEV